MEMKFKNQIFVFPGKSGEIEHVRLRRNGRLRLSVDPGQHGSALLPQGAPVVVGNDGRASTRPDTGGGGRARGGGAQRHHQQRQRRPDRARRPPPRPSAPPAENTTTPSPSLAAASTAGRRHGRHRKQRGRAPNATATDHRPFAQ